MTNKIEILDLIQKALVSKNSIQIETAKDYILPATLDSSTNSIFQELNELKAINFNAFSFEVPKKYLISDTIQIISEKKTACKVIKHYENNVVDIITRNSTTRVIL